jgi:hypothetical protein
MTDSDSPLEKWEPFERWETIPGFSSYQASTLGGVRSVDRTLADGRARKGQRIATRVSNKGYILLNLVDDNGVRQTMTLHRVILATFDGECPPGQQARHLDDDPTHNSWAPGATREERMAAGGNLMYGTPPEQYTDKLSNGTAPPLPPATFDCINHARCGGKVFNPGRRCVPCVEQVGRDAADMLRSGESLQRVASRFGYTGTEWVYQLAVKHGGYQETRLQARTQRRSWLQRVTATVRDRLRRDDST